MLACLRKPPRPPIPNGHLFPENAQGYVEFDLFEDSDEIPDDNTAERSKDHVDIPRLPPAPPPKPPRPKKISVPGNNHIECV